MKDTKEERRVPREYFKWLDILKALLIIAVVVGHSNVDTRIIQIIFWFHMPLFFLVSGYLLHMPEKGEWGRWAGKKAVRLLLPCLSFYLLCAAIDGTLNISSLACFLVGGKRQAGVYWFAAVLFLAEIVMAWIESRISRKNVKMLMYFLCFACAVLESAFVVPAETALIPDWLKLPWNVDVVPMAMAYLAAGYYGKEYITNLMREDRRFSRVILAGISVVVFTAFAYLCWQGKLEYHLDMKNSHYSNPLLAVLLPAAAGMILMTLSMFFSRGKRISAMLAYVGKASMTVMYLHILIIGQIMKRLFGEGYPVFWCVVTVLLLSCLFEFCVTRNRWTGLVFTGRGMVCQRENRKGVRIERK